MTFQNWIAFSAAAAVLLVIPGPTILAVISHSLAHGPRAVAPLVIGVALGDLTAMSLSFLGIGVILAASVTAYSAVKLLGAIYLVYLGVKLWRSDPVREEGSCLKSASPGSLFFSLFLTTTLNPKSMAFFVSFIPQFVNPGAAVLPQLLALGATFLFLGTTNATLYAVFAGRLGERVKSAKIRRRFNRLGGAALVGAGLFTAGMRRAL